MRKVRKIRTDSLEAAGSGATRNCCIEGCERKGRNKGFQRGIRRYDKYCEAHHRDRCFDKRKEFNGLDGKKEIPNDKCGRCGWDKSHCDRHRVDPKAGYTKENVLVLCPNCHREEHFPKKDLN